MSENVAVLVPSYDGYADIWPIAADLFKRFWPDRTWPMYWMTNELPVPSIAKPLSVPKAEREKWGRGIASAIERIREPFILFWIEEILLLSSVPNDVLLEAAEIMRTHPDVGIIQLNRYYEPRPKRATVGSFGHYYEHDMAFTSAMPALYRREVLLHLLRTLPKSNDFEQQSCNVMLRDLPDVQSLLPCRPMFRFCDNPLVNGAWKACAVSHFNEFGFEVDFCKRGISKERCRFMNGTPA